MGRNSPAQPSPCLADNVAAVPNPYIATTDGLLSNSLVQKPHSTSTLNASLSTSSRPPSPSLRVPAHPLSRCHSGTPPESPISDDEGDEFYDASDNLIDDDLPSQPPTPLSAKPKRRSAIEQAPLDPFLEGASKGRTGVAPSRRPGHSSQPQTTYYPPTPARGANKNSASPSVAAPFLSSTVPFTGLGAVPIGLPVRRAVKKGLVIGLDYLNLEKAKQLKHASKDAIRFKSVLEEVGKYPSVNVRAVTDSNSSTPLRRRDFIEQFHWLTDGAQEGDDLVMLFSGHCSYFNGEPYLITAGRCAEDMVSKKDLLEHLILRVPARCRLQLVLDCCHSAALVDLQYCVGRMHPESELVPALQEQLPMDIDEMHTKETTSASRVTSKLSQAPAPAAFISTSASTPVVSVSAQPALKPPPAPGTQDHLQGSLYGISQTTPPPQPIPAASFGVDSFGSAPTPETTGASHRQAPKRAGGVIAAPPIAGSGSETTAATGWLPRLSGLPAWMRGGTPAPPAAPPSETVPLPVRAAGEAAKLATGAGVRRARQLVAEAPRTPDYFKERKEGFIKPAGDITVWAAAGPRQSAFEASNGVENGIVTHALCSALSTCKDTALTTRDLWHHIRSSIESENMARGQRDLAKPKEKQPDPRQRIQHAELWVSQAEPLDSAAPVLDKRAF